MELQHLLKLGRPHLLAKSDLATLSARGTTQLEHINGGLEQTRQGERKAVLAELVESGSRRSVVEAPETHEPQLGGGNSQNVDDLARC